MATAQFCEDNGAASGTPARGTTRTTGVSNVNWKSIDDASSAYSSYSINAGSPSYEKFQFVVFTGTFNSISNGLFQHVSGSLGAGLTVKGFISGSGIYTTPAASVNSALTYDLTATGSITTGYAVKFGASGPEATGKAASSSANPTYSEYLVTQLQTSAAASAGDTATVTFQIKWDEN